MTLYFVDIITEMRWLQRISVAAAQTLSNSEMRDLCAIWQHTGWRFATGPAAGVKRKEVNLHA